MRLTDNLQPDMVETVTEGHEYSQFREDFLHRLTESDAKYGVGLNENGVINNWVEAFNQEVEIFLREKPRSLQKTQQEVAVGRESLRRATKIAGWGLLLQLSAIFPIGGLSFITFIGNGILPGAASAAAGEVVFSAGKLLGKRADALDRIMIDS